MPARTIRRQPIVQPTKTRTQNRTKVYNARGDQIHHHTKILPQVHEHRQQVRFVKEPARRGQKPSVTRAPIFRRRDSTKVVRAQQNEQHQHTIIKPRVENTDTNVQINKLPNRRQNLQDVVHATENKQIVRNQVIQAPAKTLVTQPIVQHIVREKEVHHIHRPVIKKQQVVRKINVPTPVIQKVPIVRRVRAVVQTKVLPAQTLVLRGQGGALAAATEFNEGAVAAAGSGALLTGGLVASGNLALQNEALANLSAAQGATFVDADAALNLENNSNGQLVLEGQGYSDADLLLNADVNQGQLVLDSDADLSNAEF